MKRTIALLLLLAAVFSLLLPASAIDPELPGDDFGDETGLVFSDVPQGTFYYNAVAWAVRSHITLGTTKTTFSPNADCTRAQVVTFLWRAAGCPAPKAKSTSFRDIHANAYYYKAVLWAAEQKITEGTSAVTFSPDAKCTRAQVVTFLWRLNGAAAPKTRVNPFSDVGSTYYTDAVLWAVERSITAGMSRTSFAPNAVCSRAQIVTFLYRSAG